MRAAYQLSFCLALFLLARLCDGIDVNQKYSDAALTRFEGPLSVRRPAKFLVLIWTRFSTASVSGRKLITPPSNLARPARNG